MCDSFMSTFDGMAILESPDLPTLVQTPSVFGGGGGGAANSSLVAAAYQRALEAQQNLEKYRDMFTGLYKTTQHAREKAEQDLRECKLSKQPSPGEIKTCVVEFVPEDIQINEQMEHYLLLAIAQGKTLAEVMPLELL